MRSPSPVLGASFGLLSCISFLALYSVAVSIDSGYDFFEDYLSDLGVGPGAWAFNSAVICAGVLMSLFAWSGLGQLLPKSATSATGKMVLASAGILLVSVGIFTEDYGDLHTVVSVSFFLVLEASIGLISIALYRSNALGRAGWALSSAVFLLGLGVGASGTGPASETVAVLLALFWGASISSATVWLMTGHRLP
ncbi:MAG: DUF998 domain-containing protein [Thermoplasmata archaeon]|nr:DUF998 domain-containing protein [Thermoplasmata archaeon]